MRKILIVEDDAYKLEAIAEIISHTAFPCEIDESRSVQSAVASVSSRQHDILVLDMSLPSHDPENGAMLGIPRLSGGIEVLFELNYIGSIADVVIVTQYPEIEMSGELVPLSDVIPFIKNEYGITVSACIYYDPDSLSWKERMINAIAEIIAK